MNSITCYILLFFLHVQR